MNSTPRPDLFVFGESPPVDPHFVLDIGERWMELPHLETRSRGFILLPGESVQTPEIELGIDHCLRLEVALAVPEISVDGLDLVVKAVGADGEVRLGGVSLVNEMAREKTTQVDFNLAALGGRRMRFVITCGAGPQGDPTGDWAALCCFVVAPSDEIGLASGRSQYEWRAINEGGHFTGVYDTEIYDQRRASGEVAPVAEHRLIEPAAADPDAAVDGTTLAQRALPPPKSGEPPFLYAVRLLSLLLPRQPPEFAARLLRIAASGRVPKVLSLCAGEAGVEGEFLREAGVPVDVTLMDINPEMLQRARSNMPANCSLRLWQGDVRDISIRTAERFDVIMFVSGLHHVVDLEIVLDRVAVMLGEQGEFWLVGEQVGKNGNRLWPCAHRVANALFEALPAHLRFNRHRNRTDERLPNPNFASSGFEGVRSEEIDQLLRRYFVPIEEDRRNCFMWRMLDMTYGPNYRLDDPADLAALQRIVVAEYEYWRRGGAATELNGVYRNKGSAF